MGAAGRREPRPNQMQLRIRSLASGSAHGIERCALSNTQHLKYDL